MKLNSERFPHPGHLGSIAVFAAIFLCDMFLESIGAMASRWLRNIRCQNFVDAIFLGKTHLGARSKRQTN